MYRWFKVTIQASVTNVDGKDKKVAEQYLFEAYSYTEAEARAVETLKDRYNEYEIKKIDPEKLSELFLEEGANRSEKYYKCKVNFITLDERTGREKKSPSFILVEGEDPKGAEAMLREGMKGTVSDWSCEAIVETKILEIFKL